MFLTNFIVNFRFYKNGLSLVFLLTVLFACSQLFAQTEKQGDEAMQMGFYNTAFKNYNTAFEKEKTVAIAYKCAEAARLYNNYGEALRWYSQVLDMRTKDTFAEAIFYKALMLKQTSRAGEAKPLFEAYLAEAGDKTSLSEQAKQEIASCDWIAQHLESDKSVLIQHLSNRVNTKNSETSAILYNKQLLFVSIRPPSAFETEQSSFIPYVPLSKLYESKVSKTKSFSMAKLCEWDLNKGKHSIPNFCFDSKNKRMYITYCSLENSGESHCEIFVSEYKNNEWAKPQKLPEEVNQIGFSSTQPAIFSDSLQTILYFVSDRPGGMGGNDIWYSISRKGKYAPAINLGAPINTRGNEITPFYDADSMRLFFSSDYHLGYGGYDIFYCKGFRNQWGEVVNAGLPINSIANDFYFNINSSDSSSGFLSSNRQGSYFIDNETCCNDIYSWEKQAIPKPSGKIKKTTDSTVVLKFPENPYKTQIDRLLPLSLYFHNDEPEPKTQKITTTQTYFQTVEKYQKQQAIYIKKSTQGLAPSQAQQKQQEIEWFFVTKIDTGVAHLNEFMGLLLQDLQTGSRIKLIVKGFASPLYLDDYNKKLSKRRISSLINELLTYNNGVLLPYLNDEEKTGSSLNIVEIALGSSMADTNVSQSAQDANSIYSVAAALERRVEILKYVYETDTANNHDLSVLKFENMVFSIGSINNQSPTRVEIPLYNSSNQMQEIEFINVDCSCTKVNYNKKIAPKENIILELEINPAKAVKNKPVAIPVFIKLKSEKLTQTIFIQFSVDTDSVNKE